jgi:SAM-dependent methyltransferase
MSLSLLHSLLRSPQLYIMVQRSLGADRVRRTCLDVFLKLRDGERVLDVGCGPAYILNYMPHVDYVGFDTEPRYIEYAMDRYSDRGRFFCGRFSQEHSTELAPFDAVILFGIIHHLDDGEAETLLGLLAGCLSADGRIVTLDPCYTSGQSRISRWVAASDRGRFVREEQAYRRLAAERFADVESKIVANTCRIPSTELIMRLGGPRRLEPA